MNIQEIRRQYPQYGDLSDEELSTSFHKKFYSDMPYEDFAKKIGVVKAPTEAEVLDANDARARRSLDMNYPIPRSTGALGRIKAQTQAIGEELASPEAWAQSPATRFAAGAGKQLTGAGQFLSDVALEGTPTLKKAAREHIFNPLAARFQRLEQMGVPEGDFNLAGLAGEAMAPTGLAAAKAMGPAKTFGQKVLQGTIFGGGTAATTLGDEDKLEKIAAGGGIGGGISAVLATANKFVGRPVAELVKYYFPGGASRLATAHMNDIVGEKNMPKIVAEIERKLQQGDRIPGYKQTVGEMVSGMPEASPLLALQKGTGSTGGGISGLFGQREKEQRAAIEAAMAPIAGTPAKLEASKAARKHWADILYGSATGKPLLADAKLVEISKNPYFKDAVPEAMEMARAAQTKDPTTILHNIKVILDNDLRKTGNDALNKEKRKLISNLRGDLVNWLETANPEYGTARRTFKSQSIPINRMEVGQALEKKLVSPTDQMTPGSFLRAIDEEEKTLKNVLGQPRMDFNDVFAPRERETISKIGGLLESKLSSMKPLQPTVLRGKNIAEDATVTLPQLLSRPVAFANWVIRGLTKGSSGFEKHVDEINAARLLDPQAFATAMKELGPSQREKVLNALREQGFYGIKQGLIAPSVIESLGE